MFTSTNLIHNIDDVKKYYIEGENEVSELEVYLDGEEFPILSYSSEGPANSKFLNISNIKNPDKIYFDVVYTTVGYHHRNDDGAGYLIQLFVKSRVAKDDKIELPDLKSKTCLKEIMKWKRDKLPEYVRLSISYSSYPNIDIIDLNALEERVNLEVFGYCKSNLSTISDMIGQFSIDEVRADNNNTIKIIITPDNRTCYNINIAQSN